MNNNLYIQHEDHIAAVKQRVIHEYPAWWRNILDGWRNPPAPMMMWLTYHAHYLFSTHGLGWAVDPALPASLIKGLAEHDLATDELAKLSFVLLTHAHSDHLDIPLLKLLRDFRVRFIVPDHMLAMIGEQLGPADEQMIVARPEELIKLDNINIFPLPGLHWAVEADGKLRGCDCTGYLVETGGRRWLFPGDVRDFSDGKMARIGPVDVLFAHLWLGRAQAPLAEPRLLDEFCHFIMSLQPRTVVIGHLYSLQHPTTDIWTGRHAQMVEKKLRLLGGKMRFVVPTTGDAVELP